MAFININYKIILLIFVVLVIALFLFGFLFISFAPQFGGKSSGEYAKRIQNSPNYKDGKFKNLETTEVEVKFKFDTLIRLFKNGNTIPDKDMPIKKLSKDYFNQTKDDPTRVTWFGHSTALIETDGKKILMDPMFSNVPSPISFLGPKKFSEMPISIEELPELDAVLISHDHYDHLDYKSIVKIKDKVGKFYVPLGVEAHLISWGVPKEKIVVLDWWEETDFDGTTLILTPSRHFSGRSLSNRDETLWGSWIIKGKSSNIFFSGDTGYHQGFKQIGENYGPFDLVMLDSGQYNEQWAKIHMTPEEAVQASIDLKGKLLLPIHWGRFKLSFHPWNEPIEKSLKKAEEMNVSVATPMIGESIVLDGKPKEYTKWWLE